jgi:Uma2 family endonuclease
MSTLSVPDPLVIPPPPEVEDEPLYEVVNGRRKDLPPMSRYAAKLASRLARHLSNFAESNNLGEAFSEVLFRLPLPHDHGRNRRPDVAFVSFQRWPKDRPDGEEGYEENAWDVVPELACEVVSPNDLADEQMEKVREYFTAGVQLVWVIYPRQRLVFVHTGLAQVRVLTGTEELDGGTVLPGFRLPLPTLFGPEPPANGSQSPQTAPPG